ncbi:MAG: hypothetical protein RRB13_15870 [bacterium]|nr:hypothetical protein [bacterium]
MSPIRFFLFLTLLASWPSLSQAQGQAAFGGAQGAVQQAGQEVQNRIGQAKSIFGGQSSVGCNLVYLGSYDDVSIVYSTAKQNVTGAVMAADGTAKGSCFFEVVGDKAQGGVQRFRYETQFGQFNPNEAVRVNPLDPRGQSDTDLTQKKNQVQRLSSDLAPFYQMPEWVVLLREEYFNTEVSIKSAYGQEVGYVPFDDSPTVTALTPGNLYWIDIHLEELGIAYDSQIFGWPARYTYFDLIYQKPVLVHNSTGSVREYDLYHPKFSIQGLMLQVSQIPVPGIDGMLLNLGCGSSTSGVMYLAAPLSSSPLGSDNQVTMTRTEVGLEWTYADNWSLSYKGEYMWIYLKDQANQLDSLISLDAINYLTVTLKF